MRRFPPDLVRDLATWNKCNREAREAYHAQFCTEHGCWNPPAQTKTADGRCWQCRGKARRAGL